MGRGRARGMGRGRGRGRGGPGGIPGGMDNRGKREFDRQSGMATTGVKPMDKREGSGSFNWGSDRDQIEEQLNATPNDLDTSAETPEKVCKSIIFTEDFEVKALVRVICHHAFIMSVFKHLMYTLLRLQRKVQPLAKVKRLPKKTTALRK